MSRLWALVKFRTSSVRYRVGARVLGVKYTKMSTAGGLKFPDESKIRESQELFQQKFQEEFWLHRKKYDSLLRKSKRNSDTVDSSHPNSSSQSEEISMEEGTAFEELYDMTLGRKQHSKARGIYRTLSRSGGDNSVGVVVKNVGKEISEAFQYQLAMLAGADDIKKAAKFAIHAILHYMKSPDAVINESVLMDAVMEENVHPGIMEDLHLKTRFPGDKHFHGIHWEADELFREPGIRWPEEIVCKNSAEDQGETKVRFSGSFTPFGCSCRPEIYGYRAPIHVRDAETGNTVILCRDRTMLCRLKNAGKRGKESPNVHQQFTPLETRG